MPVLLYLLAIGAFGYYVYSHTGTANAAEPPKLGTGGTSGPDPGSTGINKDTSAGGGGGTSTMPPYIAVSTTLKGLEGKSVQMVKPRSDDEAMHLALATMQYIDATQTTGPDGVVAITAKRSPVLIDDFMKLGPTSLFGLTAAQLDKVASYPVFFVKDITSFVNNILPDTITLFAVPLAKVPSLASPGSDFAATDPDYEAGK